MARRSRITAAGLAAEVAALQSGTQLTPTKVRFGTGHILPTASTTGITAPFSPAKETAQLNYVVDGPSFEIGYQYVGSDEFDFSELELLVTGDVVHTVIVDDTGNLGGKNASTIALVGALKLTYVNPPDAGAVAAVLNAPLAMLTASETVRGAIAIATTAEETAATDATKALTPRALMGSARAPAATTVGNANSLTAVGMYQASAAVAQAMSNLPANVDFAFTMAVEPAGSLVRQVIWGDGIAYTRVQTAATTWGAWKRLGGVVALKWTADVARYDLPDDNWSAGYLQMWSGGGGGGNNGSGINGGTVGGTGGNYLDYWLTPADVPAFVAIDVGDEKAAPPTGARRGQNVAPTLGNPTSFGSFTVNNRGAQPRNGSGDGRYDGGGGDSYGNPGEGSEYGGGGGGGIDSSPGAGVGGVSVFGGNGGAAAAVVVSDPVGSGTGSPGVAPGG